MFPHERSLVEKMKDEPFALVGVNSDKNFEELKGTKFKDEKITWRSFQNGEGDSAIASAWKVSGWPTLYLIDADGNICKKWLGGPDGAVLDGAVEKLVAAAKAKAPAGKAAPADKAKPAPEKKKSKS